ncbi:MAG: hypothetical protein GY765_02670, partial [bacterium]|nr:hypothetical protein [bacterium]
YLSFGRGGFNNGAGNAESEASSKPETTGAPMKSTGTAQAKPPPKTSSTPTKAGGEKKEGKPDFLYSTGQNRHPGYFGKPFSLSGEKTKKKRRGKKAKPAPIITFQIDYHEVPWSLLWWWAAGCAFLEILLVAAARKITKFDSKRMNPLVWTLALSNFYLAFRLLFAYKAYIHHPFSAESYFLAKLALIVVPFALTIAFLVGCMAFFGNIARKATAKLDNKYYHQLLVLGGGAVVATAFRLMVGIKKEALQIAGSRFALSILFVPVMMLLASAVLLFIYYWYHRLRTTDCITVSGFRRQTAVTGKRHSLITVLLLVSLTGLYGLIGMSDKGLILLLLPPFLMVNAIFLCTVKLRRLFEARLLPYLASAVLIMVFFFLLAAPAKFFILLHNVTENYKPSVHLEPREISNSFNLQRVLSSVDSPLVVKDFSTSTWGQMEELDRVKQYMELSRAGKDYTETTVDYSLRSRALHDYVTAVFMVPEFAGFWILIAAGLFAIFAIIPVARFRRQRSENKRRFSFMLFMVTGFTLFYSGLYMIGGNLFLFPFSGRNVYLWGLDSGGDILEAVVVLAMFILSYAYSQFKTPGGR